MDEAGRLTNVVRDRDRARISSGLVSRYSSPIRSPRPSRGASAMGSGIRGRLVGAAPSDQRRERGTTKQDQIDQEPGRGGQPEFAGRVEVRARKHPGGEPGDHGRVDRGGDGERGCRLGGCGGSSPNGARCGRRERRSRRGPPRSRRARSGARRSPPSRGLSGAAGRSPPRGARPGIRARRARRRRRPGASSPGPRVSRAAKTRPQG